ncbi:MAG: ParB/RepB/Spo0J family partition protein, partial [Eubacteriales bacterium]|nr:ParB/RepB/Spo0J family partition protein [Eubacteriales bacterium]
MKKGLGKGLGALLTNDSINNLENTKDTINEKDKVLEIDINKIQIDKAQPRKSFDEESLLELANSIKEVGIINPIIVKQKDEFYEIISGERRFRACKILKLKKIPVLIREYDEIKKLEVALIENIQRENLNPIEEAMIYKKFQDEFSLSQEEISERVGKKRTTIANAVRLLKLDKRVQNFIIELKISQGHAKALLTLDNKETQFELAEKIIEESLSVRQTEDLV